AVLVPGTRAPKLVTRAMLGVMKKGAVIVDVAIDQGGCFETSRPTTHSDPVYSVDGVTHYCVANMPGGVPITSTKALTNATLPYVEAIADFGLAEAVARDRALARGGIVLDAVGAGALPDAAAYGDEGSDTLGNVARAVGGLDLPNMEALGLGNVEPLEGCPPQPGAPAIAGRLIERSKGKDTTTGHWEL